MSSAEITGQPRVVAALKTAFAKKRLPHGLLFVGPRGAGQMEVANELTKALFCENERNAEGCGDCFHCRQVVQRSHPDLMIVEPDEDSGVIKIDFIRELIGKVNLKPFSAKAKVFVIHGADAMNDAAQNALLKTLEEPEGRTFIFLVSYNPERLLDTVRSRVQQFNFTPAPVTRKKDPDFEKLQAEIVRFIFYPDGPAALPPDTSKLDRDGIGHLLDSVIGRFHDLLLSKLGVKENTDSAGSFDKDGLSDKFSEEELTDKIELLAEFKEKISGNVNTKLALAVLWERLSNTHAK
jgi:DNA polymerase-3 subunit delta'